MKLCCQLCCSVFKDPVITTCGVRPPVPSLTDDAPPRVRVGCQPHSCGAQALVTGLAWPPSGGPVHWARVGGCGCAPTLSIVSTAYILSKMRLKVR